MLALLLVAQSQCAWSLHRILGRDMHTVLKWVDDFTQCGRMAVSYRRTGGNPAQRSLFAPLVHETVEQARAVAAAPVTKRHLAPLLTPFPRTTASPGRRLRDPLPRAIRCGSYALWGSTASRAFRFAARRYAACCTSWGCRSKSRPRPWEYACFTCRRISPDLVPVERLWNWLQQELTYLHCHRDEQELCDCLAAFVARLLDFPSEVHRRLRPKLHPKPAVEDLRVDAG